MSKLDIETIEQRTYRLMQTIAGASPSSLTPQDNLLEIKESSVMFQKSCALVELAIAEEREACAQKAGLWALNHDMSTNLHKGMLSAIRQHSTPKAEASQ